MTDDTVSTSRTPDIGNGPTPIVFDEAILAQLRSTRPSLDDLMAAGADSTRQVKQSDSWEGVDTLSDLIEVLETIQRKYGDLEVESWEGGLSLYVSATEWENGDGRVRL